MNSHSKSRGNQRVPKPGGSGYGGSANDKQHRNKGKKEAQKREKGTWDDWQNQLATFLRRQESQQLAGEDDDSLSSVLNILKQVLRCQAPNWWWKQPQRGMYSHALQVALRLTQRAPKSWGDPEDPESALAALEELAQTCKLLVSSSASHQSQQQQQQQQQPPQAQTLESMANELKKQAYRKASTHDQDLRLPGYVLAIHQKAVKAARSVLEVQDCSALGADEHYRLKMRPLAFQIVDEQVSFEAPKHYYFPGGGHDRRASRAWKPLLKKSQNSKLPRKTPPTGTGRSSAMALWKELSTYPTALPIEYGSSIFVRALESQLDKLRVLIIGPEDTPYANGCFVFDVTLGEDYPHKPPKVQFLTTSSFVPHLRQTNTKTTTTKKTAAAAAASSYSPSNYHSSYHKCYGRNPKVRFNPNLYDCGKVCLSLLGTWSGPSWTPNESTLLQVLVSLQSLVFCPHPYFNEPGYERTQGTPSGNAQSKQYNTKIRQQTLRVAMLPFVHNQLLLMNKRREGSTGTKRKRPGDATTNQQGWFPEFQEVIAQHFSLKKQSIRKQLDAWVQEDPTLGELYTEFWRSFQEMQALQQTGKPRPNKPPKASSTAAAACKTTNDGVILLDGGDESDEEQDSDLQQALANSMLDTAGGGVIDLLVEDSSDEEVVAMGNQEARKPAAVVVCDEDEDEPAAFAAVKRDTSREIVDLT